ncbi:MAG: DUF3089 domain-containing protein, partial [Acidimicrobiales bacterium]
MRRWGTVLLLLACVISLASCSSPGGAGVPTTKPGTGVTVASTPAPTSGSSRTDAAGTVWLCRPGLSRDPCAFSERSAEVTNQGRVVCCNDGTGVGGRAGAGRFDCFYVYPTVSGQDSQNSTLQVTSKEVGAAVAQASRFSQVCRVWAPMYRQQTAISLAAGLGADSRAENVAYASLLSGWKDYLQHFNDGRPIILIGHSQGAAMLIRLMRAEVDISPSLRHRLVVAIIAGGNVDVFPGRTIGGSFDHIAACTSDKVPGCVIAYSTFPKEPPQSSYFGRPGQGVSLQWGETAKASVQVLCVNPASLTGGGAYLHPYFPSAASKTRGLVAPGTPWVTYPSLYRATCETSGGASWLQVTASSAPSDPRPRVTEL